MTWGPRLWPDRPGRCGRPCHRVEYQVVNRRICGAIPKKAKNDKIIINWSLITRIQSNVAIAVITEKLQLSFHRSCMRNAPIEVGGEARG